MTNKTLERAYETPSDDATELDVPEEFQYTPERFKAIPRSTFPLATAEDLHSRPSRVRIEISLDRDILDYFKERAAGYEQQINDELRRVMERDTERAKESNAAHEHAALYAALVNDDNFIEAIAERLSEHQRK